MIAGGPSRPERLGRLGVFGGTFDPPHIGHLIVARDAAEALGLDRLLLVPAARPPHKDVAAGTPARLRLEMVQAAVGDDPLLAVSEVEVDRPGPSYAVDTLRQLQVQHPQSDLFLIIGADQWRELAGWKDPQALAELATIAVMARQGEDPAPLDPGVGVACTPVPVRRVDVSSSDVRARVRAGRSIRDLVPDKVRAIIEREALYRAPALQHV